MQDHETTTIEDHVQEIQLLKRQLVRAEQKLRDQELVFSTIMESTLAGYWDWYIQEDAEYMSPTFKSMFGYADHELPNHPTSWQKIIHPDDLPIAIKCFEEHVASKGEVPYDNEVRYYHKNGSIVWVYCRGKVVEWDAEGKPVRMIGCHVDITPLKRAEELREGQKNELLRKNAELEQFAYVASHDLQEPLRTITSITDLLKDQFGGKLGEEADLYFKFISEGSGRMRDLISALLDYSRLGKEGEPQATDINELVRTVLEDMEVRIQETEATITADPLPESVTVYPTELRLLFQNLISNALKFQPPDRKPEIHIQAKEQARNWKISIADNGIGIEPRHQEKIFVIFQRLHPRNEYSGTGIGLAHCKKIVDLHHGILGVTSTPGSGSTFYFTLPK